MKIPDILLALIVVSSPFLFVVFLFFSSELIIWIKRKLRIKKLQKIKNEKI